PILPPACASNPQAFSTCAINAVVVDFPLVPVIATTGARPFVPAAGRIVRANNSTSPITSAPPLRARRTTACGCGCVRAMPGLRINAATVSQGHETQLGTLAPYDAATSRLASLSSRAKTSAPPALNASIADRPERARPNTPTVLPRKQVTSIMNRSPEFQRRKADESEHHGDNPEADHNRRLAPAELLEMMMNRRHAEDAFAGGLVRDHLNHHRNG